MGDIMKGQLNPETLEALLETLPLEWSLIGSDDKVLAWNKHDTRIFKRPEAAIGRNVRDCHPKHSLYKVEQILYEMKQGKRDKAEFYIDMALDKNKPEAKEKVLIQYFAVRSSQGKYLGCLECSQKLNYLQSIKGEKRLLD
jgi:DUF438 domain-containing protein